MPRVSRLPSPKVLSQPWPLVRRALVKHCGVMSASRRIRTSDDDPQTRHCFADGNHVECCVPSDKSDYENDNRNGLAEGISRHNSLPLRTYNGRWCTCVSGNVCRQQFNTEAKWTVVWVDRALFIAVRGHPRVVGSPLADSHRAQNERPRYWPTNAFIRASIHVQRPFSARRKRPRTGGVSRRNHAPCGRLSFHCVQASTQTSSEDPPIRMPTCSASHRAANPWPTHASTATANVKPTVVKATKGRPSERPVLRFFPNKRYWSSFPSRM